MKTSDDFIIEPAMWDTLWLIGAALRREKITDMDRLARMDIGRVYQISVAHSVAAVTYMALEPVLFEAFGLDAEKETKELLKQWKTEKEKAIRKTILLDAAKSQIIAYMEEAGIWHMPLKGVILKDFYPKFGMRQMSDVDILFDESYRKNVRNFMEEEGYSTVVYGKPGHDVYHKPPVYNIEMHTSLFDFTHAPVWETYCRGIRDRLLKDENARYGYHFSDEDFYIYMLLHMYKHHKVGGTGIRSLMDVYVYLSEMEKSGKTLDWDYIERSLRGLEALEFHEVCSSLARKMFQAADIVKSEETVEPWNAAGPGKLLGDSAYRLLWECLHAGTYGTMQKRVSGKLSELQGGEGKIAFRTKMRYYLSRLIPGMEFYRVYYPTVYKWKLLIPFFVLFRFCKGFLFRGKTLIYEIKMVWKIGK